jgi:hypothetical protein
MELRPSLPSTDEDAYPLAGEEIPNRVLSCSTPAAGGENLLDSEVVPPPSRGGTTAKTMIANPITVGHGDRITVDENPSSTTNESFRTPPTVRRERIEAPATSLPARNSVPSAGIGFGFGI